MSSDDDPVLFARQDALASQLRQAAFLVGDAAAVMKKHERQHSEDMFDRLDEIKEELLSAAEAMQDGREFNWSPR